jgi:pilus assembly protein CpaF
VREAEALDLLLALNAGVPGACSIHANSARDALGKLSTLPLLAGRNIDAGFVVPTVAGCIDLVVFCELDRSGARYVREVLALSGAVNAGVIEASALFERVGGELRATGGHPTKLEKYRAAGFDPAIVLGRAEPW